MNLREKLKRTAEILNHEDHPEDNKKQGFGWFAMVFFIPFSLIVSCLLIIGAVVGIPTSLGYVKGAIDFVSGQGSESVELKASALEAPFSDISEDSEYFEGLDFLKRKGVIGGFADGSFKAEQKLTRAELIKAIVTAKRRYPLHLNYNNCFKDVKQEWFSPQVCFAKSQGWIAGFADGTFKPEDQLTKAETVKILVAAFDLKEGRAEFKAFEDVRPENWYYQSIKTAQTNNLIEQNPLLEFFEPEAKISRGEAFQILYKIVRDL
ncbi:MAG: S-layer homology domain-containing protein [Candidatus Altimarinota bacterium]